MAISTLAHDDDDTAGCLDVRTIACAMQPVLHSIVEQWTQMPLRLLC
jgi:hypothetical protein